MNKYLQCQTLSEDEVNELIKTRRYLHAHPEIGYHEYKTAKYVADKLKEMGYIVKEGLGKTGVVGLLKEQSDGKTLMLRADMDALALQEMNDIEYKSTINGLMHACGHDGHTANLLMVAKKVMELKPFIKGNVKLVFQPAEEGLNGALAVVNDGVLENPKVDVAIGLHIFSYFYTGKVAVTEGGVMAGVDEFYIKIIGKGGHGAMPNFSNDPIIVAANIINATQTIVSRNADPFDTAVVSFGTIHSGTAFNIIPETVEMSGTVRVFSNEMHDMVKQRFLSIVDGIAKAFGVKYEIKYEQINIPTINNDEVCKLVRSVARDIVGEDNVIDFRTTGGEDMSIYLERVPGCYFFVGSRNDEKGYNIPHHSSYYNMDEDALVIACEMMIGVVKKYFGIV